MNNVRCKDKRDTQATLLDRDPLHIAQRLYTHGIEKPADQTEPDRLPPLACVEWMIGRIEWIGEVLRDRVERELAQLFGHVHLSEQRSCKGVPVVRMGPKQ